MRNRHKYRSKPREEGLDTRNGAGYFDFTAFKAIANIRNEAKLPEKQPLKGMK